VHAFGGPPIEQALAIVRTSGSLVAAVFVNSLLGFLFWWVAARAFTAEALGFAAGAVAAMGLLARLSAVGIGTLLMGELAGARTRPERLLVPGLLAAAAIAFALGIAFAVLAPFLAPALDPLASSPLVAIGFGAAVALSALGFVLDQALVGMLRGGLQLLRNIVFAVGKLFVLAGAVVAGAMGGLAIVAAWAAGEALALGALAVVSPRPRLAAADADWAGLRAMRREGVAHHMLNLARFAPSLLMPVIVTALFSAQSNAVFYVAFVLAAAVQPIASSTTFTLYAVARRDTEHLARQIRLTLALSLAGVVPAVALLWLVGNTLLGVFGTGYAAQGTELLRLLTLLAVPLIVKDHWIALLRISGRVERGAVLTTLAMVVEIGGAVGGAWAGGLEGLVTGWLVALVGLAVLQSPALISALYGKRDPL
jgi:O-antigen/teichoic acid export membrane protein